MSAAFPELSRSSLIVHIAFHFVAARAQYLFRVLDEINTYRFHKIDIYIDTNRNETAALLRSYPTRPGVTLHVVTHTNLKHPFDLTWRHRSNIDKALGDYDYYMYMEDDICVSDAALQAWHDDSERLAAEKYLRGFVRAETTASGELVSTDYRSRISSRRVLRIGNRLFVRPNNPYQGFWVYSQQQMQTFVASECWQTGNCNWPVRERASAGMIWLDHERHNILVPLHKGRIDPRAIVIHLPNNYANDSQSSFGKLRIDDCIRNGLYDRLNLAMQQLRCSRQPVKG